MKRILTFVLLLLAGGAFAQDDDVQAPRFRNADWQYFLSCMSVEIGKTAVETNVPLTELVPRVGLGFTVGKRGEVSNLRMLDNTCEGPDYCDLEPASDAMRKAVMLAFDRMQDEWIPAYRGDSPINYHLRLTLRVPVEKIERQQNPDPLLFLGEDPAKSLQPYMHNRVRYDERFATVGGKVHVRIYVEPDGKVTIGEVVRTPDTKLAKEVVRVLRGTRGKWTPRKVDGVPQRTAYDYRVNYINESDE